MWSHSGHCVSTTVSGCVGSNNAAMQHILTATATTFTGCCSLEIRKRKFKKYIKCEIRYGEWGTLIPIFNSLYTKLNMCSATEQSLE